MKNKAMLGAIISGLLSFASPAASAATVIVTYTGTVRSGTDGLGLFGTAGDSLSSASFVARYIFDTDIGRVTTPSSDVAYGGYVFDGAASSLTSATLKVHNITQSISGAALADLGYFDLSGGEYYEASAVSNPYLETGNGVIEYSDMVFGNYLKTALSSIDTNVFETDLVGGMTTPNGAPYSGFFDFDSAGATATFGTFASGGDLQVSVFPSVFPAFRAFSLAAPEPTSWMMMILGFGLVGTMLRRKSRLQVRLAAA